MSVPAKTGSKQWFVLTSRGSRGPYSSTALKRFAAQGHIQRSTQVRLNDSEWVEAARVRGLWDAHAVKRAEVAAAPHPHQEVYELKQEIERLRNERNGSQPQQQVVINQTISTDQSLPRCNPGVAAILSFLIPGLGQMYKGQVVNGLVWFVVVAIGYMLLIVPGLILHLFCILGAASGDTSR